MSDQYITGLRRESAKFISKENYIVFWIKTLHLFEKLKFFKYVFFRFKKYKQSIYFLSKGIDNRVLAEDTGSFYVWFKISPGEFVYCDLCQKYLYWQVLKSAKRVFFATNVGFISPSHYEFDCQL